MKELILGNYKIESDKFGFIISEKKINKGQSKNKKSNPDNIGKEYFTYHTYHSNIESVVTNLLERGAREYIDDLKKMFSFYVKIKNSFHNFLELELQRNITSKDKASVYKSTKVT
jgi:hypothetical protein